MKIQRLQLSNSGAAAFTVFAALALCPGLPLAAADDTVLNDLEKGIISTNKGEAAEQACCDRGIYSKSFDRWLKDFCNGNNAEAEKDWAGVLKAAKGASSFSKLASSAFTRLEFLEGEDSRKMEKLGGPLAGIKYAYALTDKQMGKTEQLASLADYIANQYRNSYKYSEAISWQKKSLEILEHLFGLKDKRVFFALNFLADMEILDHDYAAAKSHADRALLAAGESHFPSGQMQARVLLKRIARAKEAKSPR